MTNAELIQKIRNEIERRVKELDEQIVDIYDSIDFQTDMDKAEERALEHYPSLTDSFDRSKRLVYRNGYHQAEKDLALTWEDVKEIVRIADTMMDFDPHNRPEWMESDKAYYTEVLKRFKETKQ